MATNENGTAPVSKYATKKKAAVVEQNQEAVETMNEETTNDKALTSANERKGNPNKGFAKNPNKSKPAEANRYPEHITNIALIIYNNSEIRRYTSIGIINYLLQKGEIKGKSRWVRFNWAKFAVSCDGLIREYSYTEPFFLNALVAAFSSFSANAQRIIDVFCHKEFSKRIENTIDQEDVNDIIELNELYQATQSSNSRESE